MAMEQATGWLTHCNSIEAPWLANGGHGASLNRHHKGGEGSRRTPGLALLLARALARARPLLLLLLLRRLPVALVLGRGLGLAARAGVDALVAAALPPRLTISPAPEVWPLLMIRTDGGMDRNVGESQPLPRFLSCKHAPPAPGVGTPALRPRPTAAALVNLGAALVNLGCAIEAPWPVIGGHGASLRHQHRQ
jgi:hypothetical protein